MTIKPFAIQGADLTLGGVNLQAGTTGVVIPGVTQAVNYVPEEIEDVGDQTTTWTQVPVVIDHTYYSILKGDYIPSNGGGYVEAEYAVTELDDDDFIDGIEIVSQGSGWNLSSANGAKNNNMWAYAGDPVANPFSPFNFSDWEQIPFRVKIRAGEIETIGGGGVNGLEGVVTNDGDPGEESYRLVLDEQLAIRVHFASGGVPNSGFAIGRNNGDTTRADGVVAIGNDDVGYRSAPGGVYIGYQAGFLGNEDFEGSQGENAIAIGAKAAYTLALDNSITLNATGQDLSPSESGLFIKPIREEAYDDVTLYYDPISGEITYAATTGGGGLAPELTKANGGILANTTITFGESNSGLIAVVDSGGNDGQWFNYSVGDADGVMYACGTNDAGPQYIWAFNPDGTVKWKVGIDEIDGYEAVPRTLTIDGNLLVVGITYFTTGTEEREIAVLTLNLSDGTVNGSYTVSTNNIGSKRIRAFAVGPQNSHIIAGSLDGETIIDNNLTPNRETWGSKVNVLTVANSSLSSPIVPWNYNNFEVQNDPQNANAWYTPDNINYFSDLPVTTVTGTGGPQTYTETTDYAVGQLQFVVGNGGTTFQLRLDASWSNGIAQTHLLAQTGAYSLTIVSTGGTFLLNQTTAWSDIGGGIFEAGVTVSNGTIPVDYTYNVTSILINKSVLTVQLRYVPAGLTNGDFTGGMIDAWGVQQAGQGYGSGDVVKVRGSLMGGINTVTLSGTSWANSTDEFVYFSTEDYPGFSAVQTGWRVSGPGITDWATISDVQNTGGLWRFELPQGTTVQPGETYTIDNNGNDIVFSLYDYGGNYIVINSNPVGRVSNQVAATTRIVMSQGVDYRGTENTNLYSINTDYSVENLNISNSLGPWIVYVENTLTTINSLMNVGTTLTITIGSTTISTTITDEVNQIGGILYTVGDLSGFGTNSTTPDSIRVGLGTYTGTWNIRRGLNSQAFILTDGWSHTYGTGEWEQFSSVVYDNFDDSIYALGEFYNNTNEIALFKFNPSTGDTIWVKYVEDNTGDGNDAGTIAVDGTGNVYTSATNNDGNTIVTKLTSTGTLVWQVAQNNSDEWNNQPSMVLDTNGDIIVGGSFYNQNDPNNSHNLWSFMKLSKTDGSLIWARYLDNQEKYAMYDMEDYDIQPMSVQGDDIYYAGNAYDENDNYFVALSFKFNTSGAGLGTYGRWIWSEDPNAAWTDNTSNAVVTAATIPDVDQTTFTTAGSSISVTADVVGSVTPAGYVLGGEGKLVFVDGSELKSAGIARHSVDNGDNTTWLNASMNGKFIFYDNNPDQFNSTIKIPSNADVPLPIGFTVTVVIGDFNNCRIYVNNDGNSDVQFLVAGSNTFDQGNWQFNANNDNANVYTIMKVDPDSWMLTGPDVTMDI
jgi:hypothetical protein